MIKKNMFLLGFIILIFFGCGFKKQKAELFVNLNGNVGAGIIFYDNYMLVAKDGELLKISPNKKISVFCNLKDQPEGRNYYFKSPLIWDMVIDKNNNIIAAAQDRILKISPEGKITTLIRKDYEGFFGATGVELDNQGNIFVASRNKIFKYDTNMQETEFLDIGKIDETFNVISDSKFLYSLKFTKDYKYLYITNLDFTFNSTAVFKFPVDADGKPGKHEIIFDKNTKIMLNKKSITFKGNPLNMMFSNRGNLFCSIDMSGFLLKINKSGEKEFINMGNVVNHYIAFGSKGFDENSIYITTLDCKVFKYKLNEKAQK